MPVVGKYNTLLASKFYDFDANTRTLVFKKKPQKGLIDSGNIETKQTLIDGNENAHVQLIELPDSVYSAYDDVVNCKVRTATPTELPDTSAGGNNGVKAPDTGAMTGEKNGEIIVASISTIGVAATLGCLAYYARNRYKHHVKF